MKQLFILDAFNLIYRMFYAIPPMQTRDSISVNALYGTAKFLLSLWHDERVDSLVIASDAGGPTVRGEIFPEYKGTRDRMPDTLRTQLPHIFELFKLLGITVLEAPGYEADDIIGSIVTSLKKQNIDHQHQLVIVSSDKDLCQFIDDGFVRIYDAMKQKNVTSQEVREKFHVSPHQIVDYLAIVGDSSDNIPGISGFGPKKAEELLLRYDSLDEIYTHLEELPPKTRDTLIDQRENAFLSRKLASIFTDIEISLSVIDTPFDTTKEFFTPEVIAFFRKYEFTSLLPLEYQEEKKSFITPEVRDISDGEDLLELEKSLTQSQHVILATSGSRFSLEKVVLSLGGEFYSLSTKHLDIRDFLSHLLTSEVRIMGYNLSLDLERINAYIEQAEGESVGQTRLF